MSRLIQIFAIFFAISLLSGCGKSDKETADKIEIEKTEVDLPSDLGKVDFEWTVLKGQEVTYYYQPDTSLSPIAKKLGLKFVEIYLFVNTNLGIKSPPKVEFYCFKDPVALETYTSRKEPFWAENRFFYGYGPLLGVHISNYILQTLPQGVSKYTFIGDGLLSLFDYSGRNYHHTCNGLIEKGELTPIIEIANNTKYNSLNQVKRVVVAASICGFLLYEYGSDKFMRIYESDKNITETVQDVLGLSIDEVEKAWRDFLPTQTNEKLQEIEDSLSREQS